MLIISFLLLSGNLSAQREVPQKNPRTSSRPAYTPPKAGPSDTIRDTSSKTLKTKASVDEEISGGVGYLGFVLGITRGEFATHTDNAIAYGFDAGGMMNLASRRKRSEWESRWVNTYAGVHFMFLRNSQATDDYSYTNGHYTVDVESKVKNSMFQIGPIFRVELLPGPLKLFAEVGAGGTLLSGVHKIETTSTPDAAHAIEGVKTATDSKTLRSNVIGYYNYAFGLRVSGKTMGVELKFTTLYGGEASYIDTRSVTFDRSNSTVQFETQQSTTDLFIPTIAVSGRF